MPFFLGFLLLSTIVLPVIPLSHLGRLSLSLAFALMLVFGAFATIRHRAFVFFVVGLSICTFVVDLITEIGSSQRLAVSDTALRVATLSIMFSMTLKRTLRPGRIDGYRVIGGIAGYLLIGLMWAFAYQLLLQQSPSALHFEPDVAQSLHEQPNYLIYFSFTTLTTVGFGDIHPVGATARGLTVAEALAGQLYIAILIAALVGMALQTRSMEHDRQSGAQTNSGRSQADAYSAVE